MAEKLTPAVVEYLTLSGVRLHITPLNIPASKAVALKAADLYPYPDPTPYQKQMENAVEGTLTPADDDPEYRRLKLEVNQKRNEWSNKATIEYCVAYPDFKDRQDILDTFAAKREKLAKIANFGGESEWDVTLYYLILSGNTITNHAVVASDFATVLNICTQAIELTGGEILNGIRMFRIKVSGFAS